jgi:hypothetical protein
MTRDADELVGLAIDVFERAPTGRDALEHLEWSPHRLAHDATWAAQLAAVFRAQGRTLAISPALGLLVAATLAPDRAAPGAIAAVSARVERDQVVATLIGVDAPFELLIDLPDGLFRADSADLSPAPGDALEPCVVTHLTVARDALHAEAAAPRRDQANAVARVALALETLGACERLMAMAVQYAHDRQQFGRPIGSLQAVQHLLAEAEYRLRCLDDACETVVGSIDADGVCERDAELLKALAGRTGRYVTQATLQVFGAIGFTWEHAHHRWARRLLTVDALYGSEDELSARIGRRLRIDGPHRTAIF